MIRLKKDGKYFDIAPGEKITTEWVSTVFNDDAEFNGSYTYPVHAPFTPNNNGLLNNAHLIENRSARLGTTATIEIFGSDWKQVKLTYDITPDGYDLYCLIDNAEFAKLIKEKMLPEVFVNYSAGVFSSFIYDTLSSSRSETITTMLSRAANPGTGSCVFFHQKNISLFGSYDGEGALPYNPAYILNHYTENADFQQYITAPDSRKQAFYNPSYYLVWVIKKLCAYLGFEATGDFMTDEAIKTLVIDNTGFLDLADVFAADGCKLAPARHLPKIKIADFIKILRSSFKLAIYFDGNERKAYFNYAPRIIHGGEAVDISGYTQKGINIQSYVPTGYQLEQAIDDDDELYKTFEYVKSYFIGSDEDPKPMNTFIGTTFMTDLVDDRPLYGSKWRVPRKKQVGNVYAVAASGTEAYNETGYAKNAFSFRVLNYMGVRYDSKFNPYYYATGDGRNSDGTEHPTALSLWLGGTNGLINRFVKEWLVYYLRTEDVEITAHLPAALLLKISPLKRLLWTTHTRALIPALINQVSFEQSNIHAGRISAKIKVRPIYNQAATDLKAFTDVKPGEIENEGKIYVKFEFTERSREEAYFGIVTAIYYNGFLNFYSDEACTKPRNVTNLPVTMIVHYRGKNVRNYADDLFVVYASGTRHQISQSQGIDQCWQYSSSKDYWTKSYELLAGADYIVK